VIPEEFIDAGDRVLVRVRQMARGEASGVPVEGEFWFVFEMSGMKVAKLSFYVRRGEAHEAAGLSE
jgi:ketosteroid isomerase-like protein